MAHAIRRVRGRSFAEEEQRWFDRIAELRHELARSTTTVAVIDYGAGPKDSRFRADATLEERTSLRIVGEVCRAVSRSNAEGWGKYLFALIRETKPVNCLELGSCLGLSALYQAAALEMNGVGRLVTLEGSPQLAAIAADNLDRMGLRDRAEVLVGPFDATLPTVLERGVPFDLVFNDGAHTEEACWSLTERLWPHLSDDALLIFDDIAWTASMQRFWRRISQHPRISTSIDHFAVGTCMVSRLAEKANYRIVVA